jgi:2-dehydropantoate 2-reductase
MRSDYDAVRANGLQVKSYEGDFTIQPPVYRSAQELGICDLLLIGLKTTDNDILPELLAHTAGPRTLVLTMQNGLGNEELIARLLGSDGTTRVLGAIAFICSNRIGAGVIHHIDHGWIRMGEFSGAAQERTHALGRVFEAAGIRCQVYDSLLQARWEKLVWNVPFNGLGVAAHANVAEVLTDEGLRQRARALMSDVLRAAAADGVQLPEELADKMIRNSESMGPYRSSMQIDFEAGKSIEVESIIGEPARRAKYAGIETPHLLELYEQVSASARKAMTGAD